MDLALDSDNEIGSETLNSSQSSMSSSSDRCSSFGRASFEALPASSPESMLYGKPHRSSDSGWTAIRSASVRHKDGLALRDFKLLRRIGGGDIGRVYLCRLRNCESCCLYAMKVVDKDALKLKQKLARAETEKSILKMLDHPFLPTLFAEFEASHYSCVVMEFCSGGDLHTLRHKQPQQRFSPISARFYAAEVLLALEYLHMLGIIYRDLKPENVLVRSDGHIMLSDFDLSLRSDAFPWVESPTFPRTNSSPPSSYASAAGPAPFSCLPIHLLRSRRKASRSLRAAAPQFVAEPVAARSCSFVGTHEYVAPEVAAGRPHGSAVDWWAFGVFIYELMYGRTPFAGATNEATLKNILRKPLAFPSASGAAAGATPECAELEGQARHLIAGLLEKDPARRVGSARGAAEVKAHPLFKGLNWALIRSCRPPQIPGLRRSKSSFSETRDPARFDFF